MFTRAAAARRASPPALMRHVLPALMRHVLMGVAPVLAEVADRAEKDGLPEDVYLYTRLPRGDILFGAEARCSLNPACGVRLPRVRCARTARGAVSAMAQAQALPERTSGTYVAARDAIDTARRRRESGMAPLGQAPPL